MRQRTSIVQYCTRSEDSPRRGNNPRNNLPEVLGTTAAKSSTVTWSDGREPSGSLQSAEMFAICSEIVGVL